MKKQINSSDNDIGHATVQIAVEATRLGAYEFIEKPFSKEKILNYVNRALRLIHFKKKKILLRINYFILLNRR